MARWKHIDGVEKVQAAFRGISQNAADDIADALNRGADEIANRAEMIVPEDEGDLARSIGVNRTEIRTRASGNPTVYVVAGGTRQTANAAFRQEFGRAPGGRSAGYADESGWNLGEARGHPGHEAQPFMFPAYWSLKKRVRGRVNRAIRAAAREVARRGR